MSWIDKWPIKVYKSVKAYELFMVEKERYKVKNVTLAFKFLLIDESRLEDKDFDVKYTLENMNSYLENLEKRLFLSLLLDYRFDVASLPIKPEGEEMVIYNIHFDIDLKPMFHAVQESDIKKVFDGLDDIKSVVMLNRVSWEFTQYPDWIRAMVGYRFRRRLAFGVVPKGAKIVVGD